MQSSELGAGPWDFTTQKAALHVEVLTRDLDHPWSIAFLPDGRMLVTERPGRLRIVAADGTLDPTPIAGLPPVFAFGIAGLTDVVLHPDFANNQLIYLSYSKARTRDGAPVTVQSDSTLSIIRARWDGGHELTDVQEIYAAEWYGAAPLPQRCCGQGPTFGSYGARMVFGQDGYLYVASGDRNYGEMSQNPASDFGKILRLRDDGGVPRDNPFVGRQGWRPEIWSLGHRNPTGMTVDPRNGTIWATEFGPRGGDELNRITRGANYGWMDVTQGKHYNGEPAKAVKDAPGMTDPVIAWIPDSANPGNLDVYTGPLFPGWDGDLLIAMMNRTLIRAEVGANGQVTQEAMLGDLGQRLRDVRVAPDGSVYVLTDETKGAILKITPKK